MAHLTKIQTNTLKALFAPMDAQELDESMDLLINEVYERARKGTETNMPTASVPSPGLVRNSVNGE